jgi:hypothetical protein
MSRLPHTNATTVRNAQYATLPGFRSLQAPSHASRQGASRQGGSSKGARQSARRKPGQDHVGSVACPAEPRVPAVALCSAPSELLHWRERQMCRAPPRERPISRASAVGHLRMVEPSTPSDTLIPDEQRAGLETGWTPLLDRVRRSAEKAARG